MKGLFNIQSFRYVQIEFELSAGVASKVKYNIDVKPYLNNGDAVRLVLTDEPNTTKVFLKGTEAFISELAITYTCMPYAMLVSLHIHEAVYSKMLREADADANKKVAEITS